MKPRFALIAPCALIALLTLLPARTVRSQLCGQISEAPFEARFDTLASVGSSNSLPVGFAFAEAGSGANITYTASDGSSAVANTYSYGTGPDDRAFGELTDTTVQSTLGACFVNNTGRTISAFAVGYTGEQWRLGAADSNQDRLDFQYSLNAASLTTGTWTDVNPLDFLGPVTSGTIGMLNGNASGNRMVFAPVKINLPAGLPHGAIIFIRWRPADIAGDDDGLAIDDFAFYLASTKVTRLAAVAGAGQRTITIEGTAQPYGVGVQLERSSNLVTWTSVSSSTSNPTTGAFTFNLNEPLATPRMFYRVSQL